MKLNAIRQVVFPGALLLVLLHASGNALGQERHNDTETVTREMEEQGRVAQARRAAENRRLEDRAEISFQDVLRSPDDVQVNYRYALKQVKDGNLLGAAATLERILLVHPELDKVRLFYAVVLYRLDDWHEAGRELETLKKKGLPRETAAEVDLYLKRIRQRARRTHAALTQSVGFEIDTNRNAAPSSKQRLFQDTRVDVAPQDRKRADNSLLVITSAGVSHDLGFQAGHEVFADFTYYRQEQNLVNSLDLQSYQYDVGGIYKHRWFHFAPSFYAGNILLSNETFLRTQGGNFILTKDLGSRVGVFSQSRIERQDYSGISENPTSRERKGPYFEVENGAQWLVFRPVQVSGSILYGNKSAKEKYDAYQRLMLRSNVSLVLPKGQFILNSLDLGRDVYDSPEFFIAARIRRENSLRYRVTYGVPLDTLLIVHILPAPLGSITFTVSYEYFRALSNIANYTYSNNKFQILLTKRWEF